MRIGWRLANEKIIRQFPKKSEQLAAIYARAIAGQSFPTGSFGHDRLKNSQPRRGIVFTRFIADAEGYNRGESAED